jgi:predicted acetyltransferase
MSGATSWLRRSHGSHGTRLARSPRASEVCPCRGAKRLRTVARRSRSHIGRFRLPGPAELNRASKTRTRRSVKRTDQATAKPTRSHRATSNRVHAAKLIQPAAPPHLADRLGSIVAQDAFGEIAPNQIRLVSGRSGDHPSVFQSLLAVFHAPSRDEFQAQLEDPFYEPLDRLLVRRGHRVLSHVHLTRRTIRLGKVSLPVAGVQWLATLPEFRSQGFATRLLLEAEQRIAEDGGVLAVARTSIPHFFARSGWAVCGRHSVSQASASHVLGHLHHTHSAQLARQLSIRLWRHVEMPALMRIYNQNTNGAYGALERTEAYWRWLVGRKAFSALMVAIDGRDRLELDESTAPIVGYAALRQEHVAEIMTAPNHPTADVQLLARAAAELVERDRQKIFLHALPGHRLHEIITSAGGTYSNSETDQAEVLMVKVIDPLKLLATIRPELDARAKQAELRRGTELALSVGPAKWRITYAPRGIRSSPGQLGRNYLRLNQAEFTRLVLGHGSVREIAEAGRIQASTQTALDVADALFPKLPLWRPVWDDLPAG